MKKTLSLVLFLGIIAALSGLCIGYVNGITEPLIVANELASEKQNLELMYPGKEFITIDYAGDDENILGIYEVSGEAYIVKVQGYGYSSTPIVALIGFDTEGTISNLIILSNQETNGYGSRCFEEEFINTAYIGKAMDEDVDMVSGATLTSTAMQNMIAAARNAVSALY